jgi:CMP-N,N'-diacetyllegionaminic acid synthase
LSMQDQVPDGSHGEVRTKSVLAIITARGGSKGLHRKNVLMAGGRPLIAWTISAARESSAIDHVVLSSDDNVIMEAAKMWGCEVPFRRPPELASDTSTSIQVVLHALDQLPGYEYVVLLQPTSPLRTAVDIDAAFELMLEMGAPSCVSVCEADQSPYWMFRIKDGCNIERLLSEEVSATRRQDLPPIYVLNGAIYIAKIDWLKQSNNFLGEGCVAYVMPKERSLDIDNADDFEFFRNKVEKA